MVKDEKSLKGILAGNFFYNLMQVQSIVPGITQRECTLSSEMRAIGKIKIIIIIIIIIIINDLSPARLAKSRYYVLYGRLQWLAYHALYVACSQVHLYINLYWKDITFI